MAIGHEQQSAVQPKICKFFSVFGVCISNDLFLIFQMRLLERQSCPLTQMDKLLIDDLVRLSTSVYTEVRQCLCIMKVVSASSFLERPIVEEAGPPFYRYS